MAHGPTPSLQTVPDDEIIAQVKALRAQTGACNYRQLAQATGLTVTAVKNRVKRLAREGQLQITPGVAGAIRLPGRSGRG